MTGVLEEALAEACAELARAMAQPDAADSVLPGIAAHAGSVLGVRTTALVLEDGAERSVVGATDGLVTSLLDAELKLREGPTVDAFDTGTASRVHTLVDVGEAWPRWVSQARALGVGAWLAVPSGAEDATVVVTVGSTRPRHWQDVEVAAAQVLADLASGWVSHTHELARVRRTVEQLEDALENSLVIEQAKGIIAGELGCTLDQAFALLRQHARTHSITVRSVAHAVVHLGLRPPTSHPRTGVTRP